jgi:hypothetical protein
MRVPIHGLATSPGYPVSLGQAPSLNGNHLPHGGRELSNGDGSACQRATVQYGDSPATTLSVVLRSVRVARSSGFMVALLTGHDQVADWSSVSIHGSRDRARAAANRLVGRWGGVAEPPKGQPQPKRLP